MKKTIKQIWKRWMIFGSCAFFVACGFVVYAVVGSGGFFDKYKVESLSDGILTADKWDALMRDLDNEVVPDGVVLPFAGDITCPDGWSEVEVFDTNEGQVLYTITYCIKGNSSLSPTFNCERGRRYNLISHECEICGKGTWSDGNMTECLPCTNKPSNDTTWLSNGTSEDSCDWKCTADGFMREGNECVYCHDGYCPDGTLLSCAATDPAYAWNGVLGQYTFGDACERYMKYVYVYVWDRYTNIRNMILSRGGESYQGISYNYGSADQLFYFEVPYSFIAAGTPFVDVRINNGTYSCESSYPYYQQVSADEYYLGWNPYIGDGYVKTANGEYHCDGYMGG